MLAVMRYQNEKVYFNIYFSYDEFCSEIAALEMAVKNGGTIEPGRLT
jgi:hypothetical protein